MSLKLIESIVDGNRTLSELTQDELRELNNDSVANRDFRALRIATNQFTGLYDYDDSKPYWLCSDFRAPVWEIEVNMGEGKRKWKAKFDWQSVILDDGKLLIDPYHLPLLLAFKYWVTAIGNPRLNAGKQLKGRAVHRKISCVKSMINAILINSATLKLSKLHLSGLTKELLLDVLIKIATAGNISNGLYDHTRRVAKLLHQKITYISDSETSQFVEKYPYTTRHLTDDEQSLGLSPNDRIKACCWLHSIGYYHSVSKSAGKKPQRFNPSGNQSALSSYIYDGKILPLMMNFPTFGELRLKPENNNTEFRAVPNQDVSSEMGEGRLNHFLQVLPLLHTLRHKEGVSICPEGTIDGIDLNRIRQHANLKANGRFKTIPPLIIFNLIRQTYEFTLLNQDLILDSIFSIVKEAQTKSPKSHSNPDYIDPRYKGHNPIICSSERQEWLRTQAQELIAPELNASALKRATSVDPNIADNKDIFLLRREAPTIYELYCVLLGCIQALIGIIMAKRQDELISLKGHGNLQPSIDPASKEGQQTEYWLIAKLKKSGIGGKFECNETIKRPIPRSFALFIWKLEQFNLSIMKAKCNPKKISLFNFVDTHTMKIKPCDEKYYNAHLDSICDFFETPLVDFGSGDIRRYYIRQHQLRRFFAMVFFWSKGFDGLDSLRWMLGHTDIEHLHNYITESESGKVLNGVKATYLRDAIKNSKLDNIDRLRDLIAKRYSVNSSNISLNSVKEAVNIYEDNNDYNTLPKIEELREQERVESHILELLDENVISLEPEFFSIYQNGKKVNDYSLTLQINELD